MKIDDRTILVVDDTPADVEFTLHALEGLGFADRAVVARDGAEALDFLYRRGAFADREDAAPAFILLDLKMPRVDGFEVLRQVKGDPRLAAIPVVVLTSSGEARDIEESYRLGANGYVVKPMDFDEFLSTVQAAGRFWALNNQPPRST